MTGSNIPTAQEVGANPVLNISRDLINKSGERTAEALIKDLPIANGGGVPISNNGTGFTPGATAVSLRGLGPQATLLLIDGRRVAPYPIGQNGTSSFFDLRSIPEAGIESIEVLKDGASTTYGADAVAGVVNIKLRHDYKGVQAQVAYGNTLDKDSGEVRANVVFGIGDGNTNVTGVIDYYHRNSIFNRDRGYSAYPIFLSTNSTPENLSLNYDQVVAAGGTPPPGFGPFGNMLDSGENGNLTALRIFFGHAPFGSLGNSPASAYTYTASRESLFNFNSIRVPIQRLKTMVDLRPSITSGLVISWSFTVIYITRMRPRTTNWRPRPPVISNRRPSHSGHPATFKSERGGAPLTPTFEETLVPPDAFNPFNPFNQIISGGSRVRILEFGNRFFDNTTDSFLVTLGARGDKLFDGTWGYDIGFRYSK